MSHWAAAPFQAECEAEVLRQWGAQTDGAHDLAHLRRVWRNCRKIALNEGGGDLEILLPAAIFHDVVNVPKTSPDRASASRLSAQAARDWLAAQGYPADKLDAVAHAIAAHSFSAAIPPETLEARILQDADRLEALGAIGLARMFHVAGATGGGLFDAEDPLAQRRPLDDRRFALDHLEAKLFRLPETMQTATGRQMAEEGVDWLEAFRTRLLVEIG